MIKVNLNKQSLHGYKTTLKSSVVNEYNLLRRRAEQYKPQVEKFRDEAVAKLNTFSNNLKAKVKTRLGSH